VDALVGCDIAPPAPLSSAALTASPWKRQRRDADDAAAAAAAAEDEADDDADELMELIVREVACTDRRFQVTEFFSVLSLLSFH